jgi:hypothetical protein
MGASKFPVDNGIVEPPEELSELDLISGGPPGEEVADPFSSRLVHRAHRSSTLGSQLNQGDATVAGIRVSIEQPWTLHRRDLARDRGGVQPEPRGEIRDTDRSGRIEGAGQEVARPVEVPVDVGAAGETFEGSLEQRQLRFEDIDGVGVVHGASNIGGVVEIYLGHHLLYYTHR